MDLQLILVISLLTFLFYQPFDFILKQREVRLSNSLIASSRDLAKATELYAQYSSNLTVLLSKKITSFQTLEDTESKLFSSKLTDFLKTTKKLLTMCELFIIKP
jgi:hypothetical protein